MEYATPHQRLHGMLAIGGALIVPYRALPHPLETLSSRSRVRLSTVQAAVVHVEHMLLAASAAEREMLQRLRVLTVGSSTVGPELRERVRAGLSPAARRCTSTTAPTRAEPSRCCALRPPHCGARRPRPMRRRAFHVIELPSAVSRLWLGQAITAAAR